MKFFIRLLQLILPYSLQVLFSILLGVATIASGIGLLGTSAYLIATAALHPDISVLQVAIVGVRFFGISRAVFRYLERLVSHSVNFKLLSGLRVWFYRAIEPLAPARLNEYKSGDLLHRVVADVDYLENFYIRVVSPPIVALVITLGASLFLGKYSSIFGWILAAGLGMSGIAIPLVSYYINRKAGAQLIRVNADLSGAILDGVQGTADIELFNQGGWYGNKVREVNALSGITQKGMFWRRGLTDGLNIAIVSMTVFCLLFIAIPRVGTNELTGVSLAVISLVTLASFEAVNPLGLAAQYIEGSLRSGERLLSLEKIQPAVVELQEVSAQPSGYSLEIQHLSFRYDGSDANALSDINFSIPEGCKSAIIGPNGSGKSTLINLLMRYLDFRDGKVLLGGVDIREIPADRIRQTFSLVSTSTYIFNDTLKNNLQMANPSINEDQMLKALQDVRLGQWLGSLPQGLETWLGEFGVSMSGGERQRLAIARALIRRSPVMLLDEPTSSLDLKTEREIIDIINEQSEGRSIVWISHSLAGMKGMDNIIVVENGTIVEQGSHQELIKQGKTYSRMWGLYSGTIQDR